MAGYNGRRAPNFSQYLDDLNAIPSPYDQALQQQQQQEDTINFDEELALFTNAEFFDFDKFGDLSLPSFDAVEDKNTQGQSENQIQNPDVKFLDFLNAEGLGDINVLQTDLNAPSAPVQSTSFPNVQSVPNGQAAAPVAPVPAAPMNAQQAVAPAPAPNPIPATTAAAGPKRKHTQKSAQASAEEAAMNAADEDKRRRNTAASARFRVKKKMREQALERTVKETTEKNEGLEARVSQLELENHWLRGLVMDKNGTGERSEASDKALSDAFKNFLESRKSESSPAQSKLGVGTSA